MVLTRDICLLLTEFRHSVTLHNTKKVSLHVGDQICPPMNPDVRLGLLAQQGIKYTIFSQCHNQSSSLLFPSKGTNQSNLAGRVCSILSFCPFKIIITSNNIANQFLFSKTEMATLLWCCCQSNEFRCSFIAFHLFAFQLLPFTIFNLSSLRAHQALTLSKVFSDLTFRIPSETSKPRMGQQFHCKPIV